MLVTLSEIVTDVKAVQSPKATTPMLVTPIEIVTDVKEVQPSKAQLSMFVTPVGTIYEPFLPAGYVISVVLTLLNNTPLSLV
jgi:hypothetical protein